MQDTYNEVIIVLITGTIVLLVLAGIAVFVLLYYQRKRFRHRQQLSDLQSTIQQELLKTQLETQEETFRQIGEDLHDNVSQLLSSTKIQLVMAQRSLTEVPDPMRTAINILDTAIQELRSLSKALNKEWLEQFNLVDNLRVEADRINLSGYTTVSVDIADNELPLSREAQVMLFRIIQEALHNGIKHAEANVIGITVGCEGPLIHILIKDNGKGFDPETFKGSGVGLINMKHRTRLLSGTIDWTSAPANGTSVSIFIPKTAL